MDARFDLIVLCLDAPAVVAAALFTGGFAFGSVHPASIMARTNGTAAERERRMEILRGETSRGSAGSTE